ncbi:MAG: menaquinone biosynthesis protein [Bacteroidales bacterium]|nr:menaquinone biosynthesis protein [Bacteroidales bacterium]MBN2633588.1 menaquinone biosynthesis protein [Bacteroidales bacterium]
MISSKVKVSAVKYANTYPFIHGLNKTGFDRKIILTTDHPAECARKLAEGSVDVGLIPVAALPQVKDYRIITDYCLGAYGKVRTVLLLSNCPFPDIQRIHLDYRSLSSVNLARILARNFWKKEFMWNNTSEGFDFINIGDTEAVVLIGDQCFEFENRFIYKTDLAEEWFRFTGLPFAFACWTANRDLDQGFLDEFNLALKYGVEHIPEVVERFGSTGVIKGAGLSEYLTKNMNFDLNDDKRKAIDLFLELMAK